MKYFVYNNVTGLIEAGGGEDQSRNDAIAATKAEWDVIELSRSPRGKVRVDIPGLFLRPWTQAELDAEAAQQAQDEINRQARVAEILTNLTSKTQAELNAYVDANTAKPVAKQILKVLRALAVELGF